MSRPKLTPWFNGRVRPARPGVYLASILMAADLAEDRGLYRYWNGQHWCKPARSPDEAIAPEMLGRALFRVQHWRGRATKPRASRGVDSPDGGRR